MTRTSAPRTRRQRDVQHQFDAPTRRATSTPTAPTFVPSIQQLAVLNFVSLRTSTGNAFVEAVAGAGKTTTIMHALAKTQGSAAYVVFNKKNQLEAEAKLATLGLGAGNRVRAATFHSFGYQAWRRAHPGVKLAKDNEKRQRMLAINQVPDELAGLVTKLVSLAKQAAVGLMWQVADESKWFELVDRHDLAEQLEDVTRLPEAVKSAMSCVEWARQIGPELIDFDDMIWLPAVSTVKMWQNDWVFVDEAQDTNPARRALVRKMLRPTGRAVFVGDRHQAIYGFTGADADAVDLLKQEFNCVELPLTVTYRCPKNVVKLAQEYVSHIQAHESAPDGLVRDVNKAEFLKDTIPTLTAVDAILCRSTKPLVTLAFQLLRRNVACHVEGRDIGQNLIVLAQRWQVKSIETWRDRLETYRDREVEKLTAKGRETQAGQVADRVDTLLVVSEGCPDVACVVKKLQSMFVDAADEAKPTLTLSTVHKAKGREWGRVFILGLERYMPSKWARQDWQLEQEDNLIYVAVTRAQRELALVEALEDEGKTQ